MSIIKADEPFAWLSVTISGYTPMGDVFHSIPAGDIRKHAASPDCWCKPVKDEEADLEGHDSWIHIAMDQRYKYQEFHEDGKLLLS